MKITPEDQKEVSDLVEDFVVAHQKEVEAHAEAVSPKRLRWDVFNLAVPFSLINRIYKYANDDHIDTLLRKIFGHKK